MNLRVYNAKDKLKETIDAMTYVKTKEELSRLFADAVQELLEYKSVLREEIKCDKLSCAEGKAILNSVYRVKSYGKRNCD